MNNFFLYGILYSFSLMAVILAITGIKKLLSHFLTAREQYRIWFALFAAAAAPFLPKTLFTFNKLSEGSFAPIESGGAITPATAHFRVSAIQDFAVNAGFSFPQTIAAAAIGIWAVGVIIMLLRIIHSALRTRQLRYSICEIKGDEFSYHISECRQLLHIKQPVLIGRSALIDTPVTFGITRPCIIMPPSCKPDELKYILLHELAHCRQKDALFSLLMQLFLAFNWLNPSVWYAVKASEADRETACDALVLKLLGQREQKDYGHTIINMAAENRKFAAIGMSGSKKQLRRRILQIAAYQESSAWIKKASKAITIAVLLLVLFLVPPASALTQQTYKADDGLNIDNENLGSYFGDYEGSFVLYDQKQDQYTVYNETASKTRVSPNSTYKIYSGLLALESGVITKDRSSMKWDKTRYSIAEWNQDQDFASAMKNSVNWYFQALDQKAGIKELQSFYDRIHYGNRDLSCGISNYWMEASLKISPLEQVMLLNKVYKNEWGFSKETITAMKDALRISSYNGTVLSGKTGTGMIDGKTVNGWFIGYVEANADVYVFAVNVRGKDGASGSYAADIAREILEDKAILP